ncbi:MAG TPA: Rne/Rng family ribonuclease [Edaphobacter sp.]|nr:Rne/Rng family ribonuclease [Edaphobacter sp.]
MSKEIYISSTPHETRLAIVENDALTEVYYERENEYTLAGSIYNGKVTRVLPGMQSSFVDIGLERDAFLYITDFMEEAGDSADFDTNGNGDSRRRNGNAPTIEGTLASEPTPDNNRTDRGDRNSRGDRGRGRGRRDRGGNRDRQSLSDAPVPADSQGSVESEDVQDFGREDFNPSADSIPPDASTAGAGDADLGEGAPGADGSRRWRGRRGRRRGRGPGQRDESPQATGGENPETSGSEVSSQASYGDDSFDIDGSAATASPAGPIETAYSTTEPTAPTEENTGRTDRPERDTRGGRDRNRNDRNRGRGDRGGRDNRDSRAPRGFAPRTSLYGVDDTSTYSDSETASAEPIVLPGESLSKYRKETEPSTAASRPAEANVILPSAPGFAIPSGWDGGDTLPGESLSRHRRQENRQGSRGEHRQDSRENYRSREPQRTEVIENTAQVSAPEIIAEAAGQQRSEIHQAVPPIPEAHVEYEPTDASASYRVDPAARSEFRQSAPVLEPVETEARNAEASEEVQHRTPAHTITPRPDEHPAQIHSEPAEAYEKFDWQTEPAAATADTTPHEVTTLHATGDLTSEAPAANSIVSAGALVEETLDEEDYNTTLHASAIEEMEDFEEEETLEGAADLGTMIREMSIDHITGSGTGEGPNEEDLEEDDFEEEDTLHDPALDDLTTEEDDEEHLDESDSEEDVVHEEFAEGSETLANGFDHAETGAAAPAPSRDRSSDRGRPRRDGRRDGRRFGRSDRNDRGDRPRHTGGAADRERGGGGRDGRRGGRSSMQSTNLPAISELLKPGQEILVQIAKEPIAKKGARITSHIALPGRFLVFMPTVNHTGVSRKIESDSERRRLKEILLSEKGEASGGFIVRTAASGASEEELRSDLRFLLNLWADIKQRSESSKSPALIYHDLSLVERILRDQVTDNFSAIWVDSETDYERILRFLQRFQPSLIRRVKLYTKETPLFEQFGITEEINKALRSKVWLKSGGSIVINQTEALVAIDINTGKFVGKTARLEDTIVKTNLDAIPEIVRQIRLRDLGGIIIIDFIDMDERKNRNRVMAALEDELKNDRAPSKVLQFNDFGLVAITRKRVKQSLERTLSTTCGVCQGTGMVKSPVTVCNDIYIEMRKMQRHLERGDVMLRVNPEVVKQLKAPGTKWLQEMEEMVGKTILVKSDPSLHPEQFDIH